MKLENIKDLKQVIDLCRKTGVDIIKIDNIEIVLGAKTTTPVKPKRAAAIDSYISETTKSFAPGGITEDLNIPTDGLTSEQLLFGSSDPNVWATSTEEQ